MFWLGCAKRPTDSPVRAGLPLSEPRAARLLRVGCRPSEQTWFCFPRDRHLPSHDWQVCLGPCKHPVRVLSIENNYVAIMPPTIICLFTNKPFLSKLYAIQLESSVSRELSAIVRNRQRPGTGSWPRSAPATWFSLDRHRRSTEPASATDTLQPRRAGIGPQLRHSKASLVIGENAPPIS